MQKDGNAKLSAKQQHMLEHIQRASQQGQRLSDYAEQHALNKKALYNYHWLLRKKGLLETPEKPPFIRITATPEKTLAIVYRIYFPNGIYVEIDGRDAGLSGLLKQVQSL